MLIADRSGLPVAAHVDSASPSEVTLVGKTLAARFVVAPTQGERPLQRYRWSV